MAGVLDYYIAGQQAGKERKTQAAYDAAAPYIAQAAGGDMGALKNAIAVPGLPTETVIQLGQWASSASQAEREAAAAKAGQVADFTTNFLRLPYQQRVQQWGAVQQFAKENGVEAPAVYDENFLNYYAMRSKGYADILKGSGATSPYLAGSQPGGQGGYQPAPAGGMTTTPLPAVEGPVKNNNPGNIRNTNAPGFKAYTTPEEGLADMSRLLSAYQDKYGLNTVEGIISRWAPPTENNTPAYIGMVADALGVSPTDAINVNDPAVKQKLMAAMIQVEHGAQPFTPDQLLAAAGGAPGAASPAGSSPAGGPTGGLPQGARMVLGKDGQPLAAGDGKVWFAPPDANGAPDWNQAVAVAPGGQGGSQGLPGGSEGERTRAFLADYSYRVKNGQPTTPQEDYYYAQAYAEETRPKRFMTPDGQMYEQPGLDLATAGLVPPKGMAAGQPGQGGQTGTAGGAQPVGGRRMTEEQGKALGYATRMAEAAQVIDGLIQQGWQPDLGGEAINSLGVAGNWMQGTFGGENRQQFEQAKRNFVNALLRRESGAVIADSEFENADKQYFPQPGDSPQVLAQKKQNRDTAIQTMNDAGQGVQPGTGALAQPQQGSQTEGTAGGVQWRIVQ